MKITTKGRVTIPREIREQVEFLPNTEVEFEVRGDAGVLRKASARRLRSTLIGLMRGAVRSL
jgi:AbrB family looped-hinge helix DNA binding protein